MLVLWFLVFELPELLVFGLWVDCGVAFAGLVVVLGIVVFDCVFLGLVLFGLRFWWVLVWFGRVFDAGFGLCACVWFLV